MLIDKDWGIFREIPSQWKYCFITIHELEPHFIANYSANNVTQGNQLPYQIEELLVWPFSGWNFIFTSIGAQMVLKKQISNGGFLYKILFWLR